MVVSRNFSPEHGFLGGQTEAFWADNDRRRRQREDDNWLQMQRGLALASMTETMGQTHERMRQEALGREDQERQRQQQLRTDALAELEGDPRGRARAEAMRSLTSEAPAGMVRYTSTVSNQTNPNGPGPDVEDIQIHRTPEYDGFLSSQRRAAMARLMGEPERGRGASSALQTTAMRSDLDAAKSKYRAAVKQAEGLPSSAAEARALRRAQEEYDKERSAIISRYGVGADSRGFYQDPDAAHDSSRKDGWRQRVKTESGEIKEMDAEQIIEYALAQAQRQNKPKTRDEAVKWLREVAAKKGWEPPPL